MIRRYFPVGRLFFACTFFAGSQLSHARSADETVRERPASNAVSNELGAGPVLAPRAWASTGPVVLPFADERHPLVSVKAPSVVHHDGRWHVFATTADSKGAICVHPSASVALNPTDR